ncbi:MAG: hypothetical protein NC342_03290 [Pseudoflavonifractor sp.]|nr:hypothetical protein [Pseudoflavonifractor sp.]
MFLAIILPAFPSEAHKPQKVTATYTYYAPETMSVEEAKRIALDRAKIQAIADEYGTMVSQSTSTHISSVNGQTDTHFFSLGGSDVKGEWLETIGTPDYDISYAENMLVVEVVVEGRVIPLLDNRIPLMTKILRNGVEDRNEDDTFHDGDELFLSFQSPVTGSILVYLLDFTSDAAYCLLPYSLMSTPSLPIEADRQYIFFSEKYAPRDKAQRVDEYVMTCNSPSGVDHNEIVILFSTDQLIKENTTRTSAELPREMALSDFEKFRAGIRSKSHNIQIIHKPIIIKK